MGYFEQFRAQRDELVIASVAALAGLGLYFLLMEIAKRDELDRARRVAEVGEA